MAENLRRSEILRRKRDLDRVMRLGRKVSGVNLHLRYISQPETDRSGAIPPRRIAFLLTREVRGAVARNRLKRRLREIYRRNKDWFPAGFDYLLLARGQAANLSFAALSDETEMLARRVQDDGPVA
ncbi:MAG: ribonuclease P protein component [candidate division WOR-3 bacterium]